MQWWQWWCGEVAQLPHTTTATQHLTSTSRVGSAAMSEEPEANDVPPPHTPPEGAPPVLPPVEPKTGKHNASPRFSGEHVGTRKQAPRPKTPPFQSGDAGIV
eukprot:gene19308-biopygen5992